MSSFLCFVCHSTVNADTNEDTRDKYREVIGMHLCPDSHLCFICCHFLNKMWMFRSICLKRSLEYPVLFSEKGTINLQRSDTQVSTLCPEDLCLQHLNSKYHFYNTIENSPQFEENQYVQLHEEMHFGLLPNNVEVQTDDLFEHFNDNLLKSTVEQFNNEFLGIKETRKEVDEFIFGNDNIESPLENINKIELDNLEEISEVNITLTDLNVRNFDCKVLRQDYVDRADLRSCFVEKQQYMRNNNFVEKCNQIVGTSDHIVGLVDRSHDCCVRNNKKCNQIVGTSDHIVGLVDRSHDCCVRNNSFVEKLDTNNVFVGKQPHIVVRSPEMVNNVHFVERSDYVVRNDDFIQERNHYVENDNIINENNESQEALHHIDEMSDKNDETVDNYDTQLIKTENNDNSDTNAETDDENEKSTEYNEQPHDNDEKSCESDERIKEYIEIEIPKKNMYTKLTLSLEEQKTELEKSRRSKKYTDAVYKCYSCAVGFLFKDSYHAHMMRHEESNGEHLCLICSLRFANPAVLRVHRANHSVRYQCSICAEILRKRQRLSHPCQRKTSQVPCHLCGKVFPSQTHYQQHIKRAHQSSSRTYTCNVCGKRCRNQAAVRTHMLTHITSKFTCDLCPSTFNSPYTLKHHAKSHSTSQLHHCAACNVGYTSKKGLQQHYKNAIAHKDKMYKCRLCDKTCPTLLSLDNHNAAVHMRSKDLFCAVCPARYSTRKGLVRHMRCHTNVPKKLPLCHACGEVFKTTSILRRHLKNVCEKNPQDELIMAATHY